MNSLDLFAQTINHANKSNFSHCHNPFFSRQLSDLRNQKRNNHKRAVNSSAKKAYNIEQIGEDKFSITLAVSGFKMSELSITSHLNELKVVGIKPKEQSENVKKVIHQGFAISDFEQKFQLEAHLIVSSAELNEGLLTIDLIREVPDAVKPKEIKIN